jgi:hypothetical protein
LRCHAASKSVSQNRSPNAITLLPPPAGCVSIKTLKIIGKWDAEYKCKVGNQKAAVAAGAHVEMGKLYQINY